LGKEKKCRPCERPASIREGENALKRQIIVYFRIKESSRTGWLLAVAGVAVAGRGRGGSTNGFNAPGTKVRKVHRSTLFGEGLARQIEGDFHFIAYFEDCTYPALVEI
jgi:hypothetical protein